MYFENGVYYTYIFLGVVYKDNVQFYLVRHITIA